MAAAPGAGDVASLSGAGSGLADPMIRAWIEGYSVAAPSVDITYDAVGSLDGIARLVAGEVDFAATDIPLDPLQRQQLGLGTELVQVPWLAGAVAVVYNLPEVELRLSAEALAGIFSGRITRWNDPVVAAANPGAALPDTAVTPVVRQDGSGPTAVLGRFLAERAPESWTLGPGPEVDFPAGVDVRGDEAALEAVRITPGSIGYAAAVQADLARLPVAMVANRADWFQRPSPVGVRTELASAVVGPNDSGASLVFASQAREAYPLSTPSYVVIRSGELTEAEVVALRRFVEWALTRGSALVEVTGFVRPPNALLDQVLPALERFGSAGAPSGGG